MTHLSFGDRAPAIVGATAGGRFYSLDGQAGRPAFIVHLGLQPDLPLIEDLLRQAEGLRRSGADLVLLAQQSAAFAAAVKAIPGAEDHIVYTAADEAFDDQPAPTLLVLDRAGRIVCRAPVEGGSALTALGERLAPHLVQDTPRRAMSAAPVLILPNILPPETCRALVAHFEGSPHQAGRMASVNDGAPAAKLDEQKKKRRDLELTPDATLHAEVVFALAHRIAPEIKRAFQAEIAFADRILIARYDDDGGCFKRHRDDAAPQTAFREFAVSLNLNTAEYDGGELLFPEFDDHRYSPPAGGAAVFSAALLHEAAPVTRGRRYVLLTFLCTARARERLPQAA